MSTAKLQGIRRVALPRDEDEAPERCVLAGLHVRTDLRRSRVPFGSLSAEKSTAELAELAAGVGAEVLGHCIQIRDRPVPVTLLGPASFGRFAGGR